jgi:hypothetical protein
MASGKQRLAILILFAGIYSLLTYLNDVYNIFVFRRAEGGSCLHLGRNVSRTKQKPIRYNVNIATRYDGQTVKIYL